MHDDLKKAVEVLQNGGLILYPTDTIWGIGCDAANPEAVKRVCELKQRESAKGMLVLVDSDAKLQSYMDEVPELAWDLIELAARPLTIIYPKAKNLAPNLLADDQSVGIRVTGEAFSHKLCQRFKKPIVSTSANMSGKPYPKNFNEIPEEIKSGVDYVVTYRQDEISNAVPSSIMKLGIDGQVQIIRE